MENRLEEKGLLTTLSTIVSFYYNCLSIPLFALGILLIFDYITGTLSALKRGVWCKQKAKEGIYEKVAIILIVFLGFTLDMLITYTVDKFSNGFSTKGIFGLAVTCWYASTEGISAIENCIEMGAKRVPGFLKKGFKSLQEVAEEAAAVKDTVKEKK